MPTRDKLLTMRMPTVGLLVSLAISLAIGCGSSGKGDDTVYVDAGKIDRLVPYTCEHVIVRKFKS